MFSCILFSDTLIIVFKNVCFYFVIGNVKIPLSMAITLKTQDIPAVPERKICSSRFKRRQFIYEECYSQIESEQEQRTSFHRTSLESIGVSPIKLKSVPKHQCLSAPKRKFDQTTEATTSKVNKDFDIDSMITLTPTCTPLTS